MSAYVGPYAMIVPNGVLKNSSDVFNILDPDSGGAATFSVALSETGEYPPTYWGCSTLLEDVTYNALTNMTTQEFKDYVNAVALERGREPVGSVTAFKNSVQIDGGGFWGYCEALGLQSCPSEAPVQVVKKARRKK